VRQVPSFEAQSEWNLAGEPDQVCQMAREPRSLQWCGVAAVVMPSRLEGTCFALATDTWGGFDRDANPI